MSSLPAGEAIAAIIKTMDCGQYLLLVMAIRAAAGDVRMDPDEFAREPLELPHRMIINAGDRTVVLRQFNTNENARRAGDGTGHFWN